MAPDYFAKKFKEAWESIGGKEEKSNLIDGVRAALTLSYRMLPEKTAQVLKTLCFSGILHGQCRVLYL